MVESYISTYLIVVYLLLSGRAAAAVARRASWGVVVTLDKNLRVDDAIDAVTKKKKKEKAARVSSVVLQYSSCLFFFSNSTCAAQVVIGTRHNKPLALIERLVETPTSRWLCVHVAAGFFAFLSASTSATHPRSRPDEVKTALHVICTGKDVQQQQDAKKGEPTITQTHLRKGIQSHGSAAQKNAKGGGGARITTTAVGARAKLHDVAQEAPQDLIYMGVQYHLLEN